MKLKIVSLLLAGIMVLSLASCVTMEEAQPYPKSKTTDIAAQEDVGYHKYLGAPIDKFEAADLGGRTFRFMYDWGKEIGTGTNDPRPDLSQEGVTLEMIYRWENIQRISKK